jgi:hypothetical protein
VYLYLSPTKYVFFIEYHTTVYVSSSEFGSPNPSLASEGASLPRTPGGGGAHSPAGEGLGESQFRRLKKKLGTLPTLCSHQRKKDRERGKEVLSQLKGGGDGAK